MPTATPHEATLRRRALRRGFVLRKVRSDNRWYLTHGPFLLVNARSNAVVASGLVREDVAAEIETR